MGPLVASAVLFLAPGVALGAVSPFIVRLSVSKVTEVGEVAGTVWALSSVGSIVGTLGTAFYLIPRLGVRNILHAIGAGLLGLGLLALTSRGKVKN